MGNNYKQKPKLKMFRTTFAIAMLQFFSDEGHAVMIKTEPGDIVPEPTEATSTSGYVSFNGPIMGSVNVTVTEGDCDCEDCPDSHHGGDHPEPDPHHGGDDPQPDPHHSDDPDEFKCIHPWTACYPELGGSCWMTICDQYCS